MKRLSNIDLNTVSESDITACALHGTHAVMTVHDAIQCSDRYLKFLAGCPTTYGPGYHRVKSMVVLDLKGTEIKSRNSGIMYPDFRIVVTPDDRLQPHRDKPLSYFIRAVVHQFKVSELERIGKEKGKNGWSP